MKLVIETSLELESFHLEEGYSKMSHNVTKNPERQSLHFHCRKVFNFIALSIFVFPPTYLYFFQVVILHYYKE